MGATRRPATDLPSKPVVISSLWSILITSIHRSLFLLWLPWSGAVFIIAFWVQGFLEAMLWKAACRSGNTSPIAFLLLLRTCCWEQSFLNTIRDTGPFPASCWKSCRSKQILMILFLTIRCWLRFCGLVIQLPRWTARQSIFLRHRQLTCSEV